MGKGKAIPAWAYKAAIVVATIIWGYSFVAMKDVVSVLPPAWLLGFRFTFAGVLLTAILWKRVCKAFSGRMLLAGAALGLADFMAFWTQTIGLEHTMPGINAFLTATYCVIVPFLWWIVAHRRPTVFNIGAAVLALVGIWLVSVQSGGMTMGYGEAMTLLCALLFAVHMVLVSKLSRFHDVLALTAVQFVAEGCLGFVFGAAFETFPGFGVFTPGIIGQLVFFGAVRVHRGVRHPERGAGAHPARASFAVPKPGIGVRRVVQHRAVRRADHLAPACRLRADFRSHRHQRNVPAQEENGRSDWGNNRLRTACYRCGRTAFRVIQCGRM